MRDVVDSRVNPGEAVSARIARSLPAKFGLRAAASAHPAPEILLVMPRSVATRIVELELHERGCRVTSVANSFQGLELVLTTRPDLVIASTLVDALGGVDLACALVAMPPTRGLPVTILTSFTPTHPELARLPDGVAIIRKGEAFADDLERAFKRFGIPAHFRRPGATESRPPGGNAGPGDPERESPRNSRRSGSRTGARRREARKRGGS